MEENGCLLASRQQSGYRISLDSAAGMINGAQQTTQG